MIYPIFVKGFPGATMKLEHNKCLCLYQLDCCIMHEEATGYVKLTFRYLTWNGQAKHHVICTQTHRKHLASEPPSAPTRVTSPRWQAQLIIIQVANYLQEVGSEISYNTTFSIVDSLLQMTEHHWPDNKGQVARVEYLRMTTLAKIKLLWLTTLVERLRPTSLAEAKLLWPTTLANYFGRVRAHEVEYEYLRSSTSTTLVK